MITFAIPPLLPRVAVHAVDQFIVLHQTCGVEAADLAQRRRAERGERAGDQQQDIELDQANRARKLRTYS